MSRQRCSLATRQWRLLVRLRRQPATIFQLAREFGVHWRTIKRDLVALEAVPFPIACHQEDPEACAFWSLASTPEWPRNEATPIAEVRRAS